MPHRDLINRLRGEFLEMPGLQLTRAQAQRLCGVDEILCQSVLDALVDVRFLCLKPNGTYARAGDGPSLVRRGGATRHLYRRAG